MQGKTEYMLRHMVLEIGFGRITRKTGFMRARRSQERRLSCPLRLGFHKERLLRSVLGSQLTEAETQTELGNVDLRKASGDRYTQ